MGLGKEFDFKVSIYMQKNLSSYPQYSCKKQEPSNICNPHKRNTKPAKSLYQ